MLCVHVLVLNHPLFGGPEVDQRHHNLPSERCGVSPLLEHVLVIVSYHWDVTKLLYLATVLDTIRTYKTQVNVVVVTDNGQALRRVLGGWGHLNNSNPRLQIWQAPPTNDPQKDSLLWAHRQAVEEQFEQNHDYTSVLYMEDDTRLSWPAVVSWALDTEVLAPLNFTRCMYRTEVDIQTGGPNLMDWTSTPLRLTYKNTLNLSLNADFARVQARLQDAGRCGCGKHRDGSPWPCQVHGFYLTPLQPYQGMWMATRTQLAFFMAHPYWVKEEALNATLARDMVMGYPERSTVMNLLINVPEGYLSNCMVPYLPGGKEGAIQEPSLPLVAGVEHMRNGYSIIAHTPLAKTHVEAAINGFF